MSISILKFEQQSAQIGIRSSPARMQISKPEGQMRIQKQDPQLEVDTQLPTFRSPRQRISNESGLMGPLTFAKQFRDKGKQGALRAIGSYAADGDFIANKNLPGDKSIPLLAKNKMNQRLGRKDFNITLMPSSPPSLDWTPGYINVNFSRHNIAVDWSGSTMANINVDTGYPVQVSLTRRPSFNVTSIEPAVSNRTLGRYIDRSV